jgi:hypothetical protein
MLSRLRTELSMAVTKSFKGRAPTRHPACGGDYDAFMLPQAHFQQVKAFVANR